jgi:hypothetical protein
MKYKDELLEMVPVELSEKFNFKVNGKDYD